MENAAADDETRVDADQMQQLEITLESEARDEDCETSPMQSTSTTTGDNIEAGHEMSNDEIIKAIRERLMDNGEERSFWLDSALKYMHMDRVLPLLHVKELSDYWKLENNLLIFSEPWLHAAALRGSLEGEGHDLLQSLIHSSSTYRWFTAWVAAENGHKQLLLRLLKGHNPSDVQVLEECYNSTSYWLYIIWRFLMGSDDSCKELESYGWKQVQCQVFGDGWTFLHFAAIWGDVTCIQMLLSELEVGITVDDVVTHKEYTALHLASYFDNVDIVILLLNRGAKVEVVDTTKRTPLHLASEQGCLESVKALIEHARDKNIQTMLVEAADVNGMTALHFASCRGHTEVVSHLLTQTTQPHLKSGKDLTCEKIFLGRSLRQWRANFELFFDTTMWEHFNDCAELEACFNGVDATKLINPLRSEIWSPGGFTALHFAVVYGKNIDTIRVILQHIKELQGEVVMLSKDDLGLTPADWAEAAGSEEVRLLLRDFTQVRANVCSNSKKLALKWHYKQVEEAEQERKRLQWTLEIGEALLAKRWAEVGSLTSEGVIQEIKIDGPVWEHLEWAIDQALDFEPTRQYRVSLIERMVVELVKGKAFSNDSCTMQRCLMWAIEQPDDRAMVVLVEAIVRDKNCELLSVARGCDYDKSPLERATDMGESGTWLVAAMEQRDDVQRRLYEDRQVYVDYANTILVGAVLIAALAYQGWLQQPQGYAAGMALHSSTKGTLVFARCNSLGFFLSMGAVMAAAVAAMPLRSGRFVKFRSKSARAGVIASLLMAASVVCEVIALAIAVMSVDDMKGMGHIAIICTGLVLLLAFWFLLRLYNLHSFLHLIPFPTRSFQRFIYKPLYVYVLGPASRQIMSGFPFFGGIMSAFPSCFARFTDAYDSLESQIDDYFNRIEERFDELHHQLTSVRRSYNVNK